MLDTCLIHPYVLKYLLNESSREKTLHETDTFVQELDRRIDAPLIYFLRLNCVIYCTPAMTKVK